MSEPTTTLNHETRTVAGPAGHAAAPAKPAVTPTARGSVEGQKLIRNLIALLIFFGAVFLTLYIWGVLERHPRTDDATARANVVGMAPRVREQTIKLNNQDIQTATKGDIPCTI